MAAEISKNEGNSTFLQHSKLGSGNTGSVGNKGAGSAAAPPVFTGLYTLYVFKCRNQLATFKISKS